VGLAFRWLLVAMIVGLIAFLIVIVVFFPFRGFCCGGGSDSGAPLNPLVGFWWGNDGGINIDPSGHGREQINHGCCRTVVWLRFRLVHTRGRPGKAVATVRVTVAHVERRAFVAVAHRPPPHVGQLGKLVLDHGVVTDELTTATFCRSADDKRRRSKALPFG